MFGGLVPRRCSRLRVFVSYAAQQRTLGEEVAQALKNAGDDVFFDRDSIPAAGDYNDQIRAAIENSDRFVFLASKDSLAPGRFTLTELQFAKERWGSPASRVLPVIVDERVAIAELPVYLRSVSVMSVAGSAPAEIAAAINKTRKIGALCWAGRLGILLTLGCGIAWGAMGFPGLTPPTDAALLPVDAVHFRSLAEAPYPADAPGASTDWADTPTTITISPLAYQHRTEPGRRARILSEQAELHFAGTVVPYKALYVVEITDRRCGDKWYCVKGNAGPETLEPGKTISREMMFFADGDMAPHWREFVNAIMRNENTPIKVVLTVKLELQGGASGSSVELRKECVIDSKPMQEGMSKQGFDLKEKLKPVYLQGPCLAVGGQPASNSADEAAVPSALRR